MSREIKFRMWNCVKTNPSASKMFYDNQQVIACLEQQIFFDCGNKRMGYNHAADGNVFMQFTGLKDKSGKDGYHKDIVKSGKKLYTIEWQDEEAMFWLAPQNHSGTWKFMDELNRMEIIGNTFEHSHLIGDLNNLKTIAK